MYSFQETLLYAVLPLIIEEKMTECPTCKLSMDSHSTAELMECCMKQVGDEFTEEDLGICPNCRHEIKEHTDKGLAECTLAFLKSGISS